MKIHIRELNEGSNLRRFEIPPDRFEQILREVDDLYRAEGAPCVAEIDVQRVDSLLSLRGTVDGDAAFSCARCLADRPRAIDLSLHWTLLPKEEIAAGLSPDEEVELTAEDLDTSFYDPEAEIDLEALVREAILLELEPIPRCDVDDCEASAYGDAPAEPEGEPRLDPRWAPLAAMLADDKKN